MQQQTKHLTNSFASQNEAYGIIIFLFWPFLAFIYACTDFSNKINRIIIIAFFALYGLTFYVNPVMDGQRRVDSFERMYSEPFENLYNTFDTLYEETLDFVELVIMYSVSRFSDFYGVLFAVYALIFGGLMLHYLKVFYKYYTFNPNPNTVLFFILLVCANFISNINGFRMWFAAWVFAVGVLKYLHKPNYIFVLLSACSILVHFSFLPVVGLFVIYTVVKNWPKIYGILAIITFFMAELNIQKLQQYAAIFGSASEKKINAYTGEEYIETVSELAGQGAWYIELIKNGLKYFVLFSLAVIFIKTRGHFKTKVMANFYSFTLLLLSFANISSLVPSGGRFYTVFNIFAFSTILLYYVYEFTEKKITSVNKIGVPIVGLYVVFTFRLFSDSASLYLIGPTFFMHNAFIENVSLQSFIF